MRQPKSEGDCGWSRAWAQSNSGNSWLSVSCIDCSWSAEHRTARIDMPDCRSVPTATMTAASVTAAASTATPTAASRTANACTPTSRTAAPAGTAYSSATACATCTRPPSTQPAALADLPAACRLDGSQCAQCAHPAAHRSHESDARWRATSSTPVAHSCCSAALATRAAQPHAASAWCCDRSAGARIQHAHHTASQRGRGQA